LSDGTVQDVIRNKSTAPDRINEFSPVHQATTILDQKYKKFQCLGLDWDNLTVFQQAKAIEVNLNVVKSITSAQGSTSTFHYFIHPKTSGVREYRVRVPCLRFLQKHGGINEHQAVSGNSSQNNDYLPGHWRSVASPQG